MIRTLLHFEVMPGHAAGLADVFRSQRILEMSVDQDGCLSADLCVSPDGSDVFVTALWDDEEAYRRWTGRTDRGDMTAELNKHLVRPVTPDTVGVTYTVAHAPGAAGSPMAGS